MPVTGALAVYASALLIFHGSEFCLAAIFQREELGWSSLLLSRPYALAMASAVAEYLIEMRLFSELKSSPLSQVVSLVGGVALVCGAVLRLSAILTARCNFTHMLRFHLALDHQLVTCGIYGIMRHPGYAGFFVWATGTQLLLVNPLCFIMFATVIWRFFNQRILVEERQLLVFFGQDYVLYKKRVPSGIPAIS